MAPDEFWKILARLAKPKLVEVLGRDLKPCAVEKGQGVASLGCFLPVRPRLSLPEKNGRRRIRLRLHSGPHEFCVPVTDIRLFADDHVTPDPEIVRRTEQRLRSASSVVLSVGLGRPFKKTASEPARHWLQVNNVHFADEPCWRLG